MARTRAAVLDGAARSIATYGSRRTTMADIASLGGVAKATLYNHFRRKADVYAALAEAEVRRIGAECAGLAQADLGAALTRGADLLAEHPVVRRLAVDEPEVLAVMIAVAAGAGAEPVRAEAAAVLAAADVPAGPDRADLVVRWMVSHVAAPGTPDGRAAAGRLLAELLGQPE